MATSKQPLIVTASLLMGKRGGKGVVIPSFEEIAAAFQRQNPLKSLAKTFICLFRYKFNMCLNPKLTFN